MVSVIGPVQSRYREAVQYGKRNLRLEGFGEKVGFELGVMDDESGNDDRDELRSG